MGVFLFGRFEGTSRSMPEIARQASENFHMALVLRTVLKL